MVITLVGVLVSLSPLLIVIGLLGLAARRDALREATIARQIRLTDAIAGEVGAIVAPVVKRRLGGRWQIEMALPLERPAIVGRILAIAHRVLPGRYELVLTPQEPVEAALARSTESARPRLKAA